MAILRIRDENGNVQEILALKGDKGEKGEDGTVAFDELTEEQKASLKGDKGDKGDDNVLHVTIDGDYASHTPTEIQTFIDSVGGLVILKDGYFLEFIDNYYAFFKKRIVGTNNELTTYSYQIDQKGKVSYSEIVNQIVEIDQGLERGGCAADAKAVGDRLDEIEEQSKEHDTPTEDRYFDITEDGVISLKPVYRGAWSFTYSQEKEELYKYAISDNGIGKVGSENNELPENIVIPESVNGIAVTRLPVTMFASNEVVKTITIPNSITEIPESFAAKAYNLHTISGTENVKKLGKTAFYYTRLERANFPNLEDVSSATSAFMGCPNLVYADIGNNITGIPAKMFSLCLKLKHFRGGEKVTSVGQSAFYRNLRLKKPVFIPNLTSIGEDAFRYCRINYNWQLLKDNGCSFGATATSLQYNPTDFWSGVEYTACENQLWSTFAQGDPKWANDIINNWTFTDGTPVYWGANGCVPTSSAMIYSAFEGKYCSSPKEYVDAVFEAKSAFRDITPRTLDHARRWLGSEGVGYATTLYQPLSGNLKVMYDALASGALVLLTVDDDDKGFDGGHVVVVYGINEHGELLVQDPSAMGATVGAYDVPPYAMPIQNIAHAAADFLIVTKG